MMQVYYFKQANSEQLVWPRKKPFFSVFLNSISIMLYKHFIDLRSFHLTVKFSDEKNERNVFSHVKTFLFSLKFNQRREKVEWMVANRTKIIEPISSLCKLIEWQWIKWVLIECRTIKRRRTRLSAGFFGGKRSCWVFREGINVPIRWHLGNLKETYLDNHRPLIGIQTSVPMFEVPMFDSCTLAFQTSVFRMENSIPVQIK